MNSVTDAELLNVCGPSWAAMTPAQRARYGPPMVYTPAPTLFVIAGLLDLVREFPRAVRSEGLARVARRWDATPSVIALAERIDNLDGFRTLVPQTQTLATPPNKKPRSLHEIPGTTPRSLMLLP